MLKQIKQATWVTAIGFLVLIPQVALAHEPIFGLGPHVLFKDGIKVALELESSKAGSSNQQGFDVEMRYGITSDWSIGAKLPYQFKDNSFNSNDGLGDISLLTKYRFWREDSLGLQRSAAVLLRVISDSASTRGRPSIGSGATDTILGLTYGYEGRKWYHWASARYRSNGKNNAGVDRGDKVLIDFVGGIRPNQTSYLENDIVYLIELNGEFGQRARVNGSDLTNTGGEEWFLSPGIFWTARNFAIKGGVQIPIYSNLNGNQDKSDYRTKVSFEWNF